MQHKAKLTKRINLARLDALEADLIVIFIVGKARESRPDGTMLEKHLKLGSKRFAIEIKEKVVRGGNKGTCN